MNKHIIEVMQDIDYYKQKMINVDPEFENKIMNGTITKEELNKLLASMMSEVSSVSNSKVPYLEMKYNEPKSLIDGNIEVDRNSIGRYFIILKETLSDASIAIKIGTDLYPLVDINNNPVIFIEKGLWEVVENTNFFTLIPKDSDARFLGTANVSVVMGGKTFYSDEFVLKTGQIAEYDEQIITPSVNNDIVLGPGVYNDLTINPKTDHVLSAVATPDKGVEGYTFYKDNPNQLLEGEIPNHGDKVVSINDTDEQLPAGFYESITIGPYTDINLTASALPEDVLAGKEFYNTDINTIEIGTLENKGDLLIQVDLTEQIIPEGYYNSIRVTPADPITISGNALDSDVLEDDTFYSNSIDVKHTGNIPVLSETTPAEITAQDGSLVIKLPRAYYNQDAILRIIDENFKPENYSEQVTMFGERGLMDSGGLIPIIGNTSIDTKAGEILMAGDTIYTFENKDNLIVDDSEVIDTLDDINDSFYSRSQFSKDSLYMINITSLYPHVILYKKVNNIYTKVSEPDVAFMSSFLNTEYESAFFSDDNKYVTIVFDGFPYFICYKIENDQLIKLPLPEVPPADTILCGTFITLDEFFVGGFGDNNLIRYKIINNIIHSVPINSDEIAGIIHGIKSYGDLLFINTENETGRLKILKKINNRYELQSLLDMEPFTRIYDIMYVSDKWLVFGINNIENEVWIYRFNGSIYQKLPKYHLGDDIISEWSIFFGNEKYLIAKKLNTDIFLFYKVENGNLIKLTIELTIPDEYYGNISPDSKVYTSYDQNPTGDGIVVRDIIRDIKALKSNNTIPVDFNDLGYTEEDAAVDELFTMHSLIRNY